MLDKQKYISYSLFGSDLKYYVGAEKNVIINKKLLPNWDTIIYYHPENFKNEYFDKLNQLGATLINVSEVKIGGRPSLDFPYFWRFLIFLKNSISLTRDLDSRLSKREVEYIHRWEKEDKKYFVIRDHPWHSPYPSGLFGIKGENNDFEVHFNQYIESTNLVWGTDQDILEKFMSNKSQQDIFYCGFDRLETYIPRDDKNFFIGMQLDEFDNPTVPSGVKCLDFLNELNLPHDFKKKNIIISLPL